MATLPITLAASSSLPPAHAPTLAASAFSGELQSLLNLADIPDPGGGPPAPTAEGGASNQGPNAQSNQPDFLPLLISAGLQPAPTAPGEQVPLGLPSKGGKDAKSDPSLLALAAIAFNQPTLATIPLAPPIEGQSSAPTMPARAPATLTESVAAPKLAPPTPELAPADAPVASAKASTDAQGSPPAPSQAQAVVQVTVNQPLSSDAPRPLPPVRNAVVSAVVAKGAASSAKAPADGTVSGAATEGGSSQEFAGNPQGDRTPSQSPSTPDTTTAGAVAAGAPPSVIQAKPTVVGPALSDPQRLDVVRQLVDRIELMAAARPQQGVTIHLQPHGLGDVTIIVKGLGKDIEATFSATNTSVRNALADSRDALTQAVTAKGYNLVGVNIAAHSQSTSGRDRQPAPNQPQPSQAFGNPSNSGAPNGGGAPRGGLLQAAATTTTGTETDAELPAPADNGVDYRI
ncbi:MAG: flagellar hook-length control protein FliK [Fimbriimonadaceae bacterium]